ncbi:MAG TPA: peptidoglycan bridge formation glycyltransferase FemA/FemB family protein [Ktedonobacterales bacterium]|nr:peptidoglycan bridge formation glycyltransferase FemA/FemB family protein [Ktedonobacterales bacterium]
MSEHMRVEVIAEREQWNGFVEANPTGNVTQTFEWAGLSDALGGDVLRLGALDGDELRGAMLVVVAQAPLLRRPYLYVPRGPVLDDPASAALPALVARARDEARTRGAFMLKVEPNVPDGDAAWLDALARQGFRRNRFATHARRSWVVDISPDEEAILAGMKEKWRYNIRLAGRKGVQVRAAQGPEDVETFYALYEETAARDGFFIHPQRHYAEVLRLYGERDAAVLLLAEYEGTPIAGLIAVKCGPTATYMFGASSDRERNRMPNHLLQWSAIRWAKAHGCTLYDFRAIAEVLDPQEHLYSLYTYKQGFGGYSTLALETHDLPFTLPIYWAYERLLRLKRGRERRQHERELRERAAPRKPATAPEQPQP